MYLNIKTSRAPLKEASNIELPDFTLITGENGSGKSQLLRRIIEDPYQVWLTTNEREKITDIAYSPQGFDFDLSNNWIEDHQRWRSEWEIIQPFLHLLEKHAQREYLGVGFTEMFNSEVAKYVKSVSHSLTLRTPHLAKEFDFRYQWFTDELIDKSLAVLRGAGKRAENIVFEDYLCFIPLDVSIY